MLIGSGDACGVVTTGLSGKVGICDVLNVIGHSKFKVDDDDDAGTAVVFVCALMTQVLDEGVVSLGFSLIECADYPVLYPGVLVTKPDRRIGPHGSSSKTICDCVACRTVVYGNTSNSVSLGTCTIKMSREQDMMRRYDAVQQQRSFAA